MQATNKGNNEMSISSVAAIGTAVAAAVTPALLAIGVAGVALATSGQEAKAGSYGMNINGNHHRVIGGGVRSGFGIYSY